jgi:hypothetical protein
MFDHSWDFERLVDDGAPRQSGYHGSCLFCELVDPAKGF